MPDKSYYRVDEMGGGEREEFLAWYETSNSQLLHNKHVLEAYCQDDVTVQRQDRKYRGFSRIPDNGVSVQ